MLAMSRKLVRTRDQEDRLVSFVDPSHLLPGERVSYANQLRRLCPQLGDKWHLDEVFVSINGERHYLYLWRAVDQDGHILDLLVQRRRDQHAVKKFFRKLLKGCQYVPWAIITDNLKSYGAAKRGILPGVEHRQPYRQEIRHRFERWAEITGTERAA
jgi:transposase-like protein